MILGFIDYHPLYIIGHIIGTALGVGGAFLGDLIFLASARDGKISATELKFIKLSSLVVWLGLLILVISGVFLFFENEARYLASDKFAAKMFIVAVIFLNGLVFHFFHIKKLEKGVDRFLSELPEVIKYVPLMIASGAISGVSWLFALVLGTFGKVPITFAEFMMAYFLLLGLALGATFLLRKKLIPLKG